MRTILGDLLPQWKKRPTEGSFVFDAWKTREWMVKWYISAEVAFNKVDDPFFAPWMESLQPEFSGVGHQTMHNDCIDISAKVAFNKS
jgi:hypothetical protein